MSTEDFVVIQQSTITPSNNNNPSPKTPAEKLLSDAEIISIAKISDEGYDVVTSLGYTVRTWINRGANETRRAYYERNNDGSISFLPGAGNLCEQPGDAAFFESIKEKFENPSPISKKFVIKS